MNTAKPMIQLDNVSKEFLLEKDGKHTPFLAVKPTTLHIKQGEIFGIIGASGAGKSTLIRCVNLLERPTTGSVVIDGEDLTKLDDRQLIAARRQIGMIFQHFNLLHSRTVFDNVALPLELSNTPRQQIKQKVDELLALVGLTERQNAYPANLSGGQKQRVAIARALACDPKVLLCDEATSALDPATTQSILKLLKDINATLGITILLITHEMEVVKRICHQVAIMDQGQLIEQGSVSDIFANPQTALAKQFIQSTLDIGLPDEYMKRLSAQQISGTYPVIKIELTGSSDDLPLLSQLAKRSDVEFDLLSSQVEYAGDVRFGFMIARLVGSQDAINQSIEFLQTHQTTVGVLGYV